MRQRHDCVGDGLQRDAFSGWYLAASGEQRDGFFGLEGCIGRGGGGVHLLVVGTVAFESFWSRDVQCNTVR